MKKFLILAVASISFGISASAQLSTGVPSSKEFSTGNRAREGDFGLYFGISGSMIGDLFDSDVELKSMPLVNLKYMASDRVELRVGLELYKTKEKVGGNEYESGDKYKYTVSEYSNRITPGVAYHFSRRNILDVYAGAQGLIGWSGYGQKFTYEGDKYSTTRTNVDLGIGGVIGLQVYIANLPIALGVEYGIGLLWETGLKFKYRDDSEDVKYYTVDADQMEALYSAFGRSFDIDYDKLHASRGTIGNTFAVTLTYFFKK